MTSAILVDYVQTHHILGALQMEVQSEEIYRAGNFAQAEILRECELLEEYITATFVTSQELYSSADAGWEFLARCVRVKFGKNAASPFAQITPKDLSWVNEQRYKVAQGYQKPQPPIWLYHTLTNPLSLGFWGEPASASDVNLTIVRGHSDADNIDDSTDPLIPQGYDEVMVFGTLCKLVEFRAQGTDDKGETMVALSRLLPTFEAMKQKAKLTRTLVAGRTLSLKGVRA